MNKKIYNPQSTETINSIVNGNPTGIANFVSPSRTVYKTIFEGQIARFWNPATVNITEDKKAVKDLNPAEYRMYELVFGKLIFNDSIVTNRIMDNINPIITDPIANACIAFQAAEEALHSYSYAFIGDDILGSEVIYELFKTDPELIKLADMINGRYSAFDSENVVTDTDKALVAIANLCLEGVSFPAGFLPIWALGNSMKGSASMITEISRNELGSHLPLYVNIYNHIIEDCKLNKAQLDKMAKALIVESGEEEKSFLKYSCEGVLGFTHSSIDNFMDWIVSNRLRELGIEHDIKANANDGLVKIFKSYSELNETRSNFFESTVKNYSKQELDMSF
ncbi:MAG: ribonucleoside-diphosphate reductase beta chain [Sulfurimonas sp.]|jgi:ribonucleoside-diphosphate reductase beta chain